MGCYKELIMANTKENMKMALALSKRDQAIEFFKASRYNLNRIFKEGPKSDVDVALVKQCVCFVIAEVSFSKAEQKRLEKS